MSARAETYYSSVVDTCEEIADPPKPVTERWFRRSYAPDAEMRLFSFPYAGGSARAFRDWPNWFAPEVEFVAVELPGRGIHLGSTLIDRIGPLVDRLLTALGPLFDLPFAFFGHSMGALIAFELSRALSRSGRAVPEHLFVSGVRPPHLFPIEHPVHALPDKEFIERLRQLDGIPAQTLENVGMLELYMPVLRADLHLAETYVHRSGPPLSHPITVFGGVEDPTTPSDCLSGWAIHTRSTCTLRLLAGGHFFIHQQPHVMAASILNSLGKPVRAAATQSMPYQDLAPGESPDTAVEAAAELHQGAMEIV